MPHPPDLCADTLPQPNAPPEAPEDKLARRLLEGPVTFRVSCINHPAAWHHLEWQANVELTLAFARRTMGSDEMFCANVRYGDEYGTETSKPESSEPR